jgi:hypothetical protein
MSTSATNIQPEKITFKLKAIELLDATLNHPGSLIPELTIFHFDVKLEQKVNIEEKLLFIVNDVEIFNEDRKLKLGSIKISCAFGIDNFTDFVDIKTNFTNLPDPISMMLNSITLSTTRGVMFSQFKGTFLHHAYLPIIDPKSFIPQVV